MTAYKVVNPATGATLEEFPEATDAEISSAIAPVSYTHLTLPTTILV